MFSLQGIAGFVFLEDVPDVQVISDVSYTATVAVTVDGSTLPTFKLYSVEFEEDDVWYESRIRMKEILRSAVPDISHEWTGAEQSAGFRLLEAVSVLLDVESGPGNDSLEYQVIRGGADGRSTEEMAFRWLTWRPQSCLTGKKGKESLTAFSLEDKGITAVMARVYAAGSSPVTVNLTGTLSNYTADRLLEVDCSYSTIAKKVALDDIQAYDVYLYRSHGGVVKTGPVQRFVVADDRLRMLEFVFVNSLGVMDRVYAAGDREMKLEGGSTSFLNAGIEREIGNDASERREVRSGLLASRREAELWLDFLKSRRRWAVDEDGTLREIIVDSYETDLKDYTLGSVSFVYHLAEKRTGRYYENAETLEDYAPDTMGDISEEDLAGIQETLAEDPEALDAQIKRRLQAVGILMGAEKLLEEMDPTIVLKTEAELEELRNSDTGLSPDKIYLGYEEDGE